MDEQYLWATVRYVEINLVKAKLCEKPEDWRWSSAGAYLRGKDDQVVSVKPLLERVPDWNAYLCTKPVEEELNSIRKHSSSGRPAGDEIFIQRLETLTDMELHKKKPWPKSGNK